MPLEAEEVVAEGCGLDILPKVLCPLYGFIEERIAFLETLEVQEFIKVGVEVLETLETVVFLIKKRFIS